MPRVDRRARPAAGTRPPTVSQRFLPAPPAQRLVEAKHRHRRATDCRRPDAPPAGHAEVERAKADGQLGGRPRGARLRHGGSSRPRRGAFARRAEGAGDGSKVLNSQNRYAVLYRRSRPARSERTRRHAKSSSSSRCCPRRDGSSASAAARSEWKCRSLGCGLDPRRRSETRRSVRLAPVRAAERRGAMAEARAPQPVGVDEGSDGARDDRGRRAGRPDLAGRHGRSSTRAGAPAPALALCLPGEGLPRADRDRRLLHRGALPADARARRGARRRSRRSKAARRSRRRTSDNMVARAAELAASAGPLRDRPVQQPVHHPGPPRPPRPRDLGADRGTRDGRSARAWAPQAR